MEAHCHFYPNNLKGMQGNINKVDVLLSARKFSIFPSIDRQLESDKGREKEDAVIDEVMDEMKQFLLDDQKSDEANSNDDEQDVFRGKLFLYFDNCVCKK